MQFIRNDYYNFEVPSFMILSFVTAVKSAQSQTQTCDQTQFLNRLVWSVSHNKLMFPGSLCSKSNLISELLNEVLLNLHQRLNWILVMSTMKMITYNEHIRVILGPNQADMIPDFRIRSNRPRKIRFAQESDPIQDSRNNGFSRKFRNLVFWKEVKREF